MFNVHNNESKYAGNYSRRLLLFLENSKFVRRIPLENLHNTVELRCAISVSYAKQTNLIYGKE